ncbi:MAG: ATP-binding protein [Bradymonadia bacterium]
MTTDEPSQEPPRSLAHSALDVLDLGVFVLDSAQRFTAWNEWMSRHADRAEPSVLGQQFLSIFPQMASHRLGQAVEQALKYGMSSKLSQALHIAPLPLYPADARGFGARRIDQMIHVRPLDTAEGRQCMVEVHDVTATARRERQLRQQAKHMESLAREAEQARDDARLQARQLEQTNDALNRARNEAIKLSQEHNDFLAMMNHEVHGPLNQVMAALNDLEASELKLHQTKRLNGARQATEDLSRLIGDVLELHQLKAQKPQGVRVPFEPEQLKQQLLTQFAPMAGAKHLNLDIEIDPHVPGVLLGDLDRLSQIMERLIHNAIRFTTTGRVQVSFKSVDDIAPGQLRLLCSVADTGPGIPTDARRKIFDPFIQLSSRAGGAGLGLALARQLSTALKGRIWVESEVDEGSCFHVTLPMKRPHTHGLSTHNTTRHIMTPPPLEPLEILLAQSDLLGQQALEDQLTHRQHSVVLAPDMQRALDSFVDHRFDVILLDVALLNSGEGALGMMLKRRAGLRGYEPLVVVFDVPQSRMTDVRADRGVDLVIEPPLSLHRLERALLQYLPKKATAAGRRLMG